MKISGLSIARDDPYDPKHHSEIGLSTLSRNAFVKQTALREYGTGLDVHGKNIF